MSGAITALAALGFAQSVSNGRLSLVPVTDNTGRQLTAQDGAVIYKGIDVYVALREEHFDEMEITRHPVAQGSTMQDHAYALPARLTMQMGWSPSAPQLSGNITIPGIGVTLPTFTGFYGKILGKGQNGGSKLRDIYTAMLTTMRARQLLTISTGKRLYSNMLIKSVQEDTTAETENALILNVIFEEILLASVTVTKAPVNTNPGGQLNPQQTTPVQQCGPVQTKAVPGNNYSGAS